MTHINTVVSASCYRLRRMGMTSHGRRICFHHCAAIVQLSGILSANIAGSFRALWNETFLQLSVYVHALYPSWGYVVFILLVLLKFLETNGRFVLKINFDVRDSMSLAVLLVAVNHGHVDCSVSTCDCKNMLLGKKKKLWGLRYSGMWRCVSEYRIRTFRKNALLSSSRVPTSWKIQKSERS